MVIVTETMHTVLSKNMSGSRLSNFPLIYLPSKMPFVFFSPGSITAVSKSFSSWCVNLIANLFMYMIKHSCPKLGWWIFYTPLYWWKTEIKYSNSSGFIFRQCLQVCFSVSLAARVCIIQSRVILTISYVTRQRLFVAVLTIICSHCLLRLWTTA